MALVPGGGIGGTPTGTEFADLVAGQIGVPYVWGGDTTKGFDCSGLVYWAAQQLGVRGFPRTSEEQWAAVQRIPGTDLQPGDLIFLNYPGESSPGHVVIYAGGGEIIQAPSTGQLVQKDPWSVSQAKASGATIVGYGRIPGLTYAGEPSTISPGGGGGQGAGDGIGSWVQAVLKSLPFDFWGVGAPQLSNPVSDIAAAILAVAGPLIEVAQALDWFVHPDHWIRLLAGVSGTILVFGGIWQMSHAGEGVA